jgi:hypothetical protein
LQKEQIKKLDEDAAQPKPWSRLAGDRTLNDATTTSNGLAELLSAYVLSSDGN